MSTIASQITSLTIVYSTIYSGADQSKHQSSASLAFVWEIHRGPVNSPHKCPVTQKMFQFDDVIMYLLIPALDTYFWHQSLQISVVENVLNHPFPTDIFLWIVYTGPRNFVVTVHADTLTPNSARPSTGTMMTKQYMHFTNFLCLLWRFEVFL